MTLGYHGDLPAARWNPPPPPITQAHQSLSAVLAKELAGIPIQQQTVIVAALWDMDSWGVDILSDAPTHGRYDGQAECLIDFDQYQEGIGDNRRRAAQALAEDLMDQAIPDWRNIREFGPHWDADPPDLD